ncbi:MAG: prephenate dehydratase domain-containing protein [Kiritimatiellia bacterium]|jgi:prephenate dehydratase|nr:prephenate dehydratase domain-containing protein [Kiritimatiellia bacterium]
MSKTEVAFLGPRGTYSHLVAEKRFGKTCAEVPLPTVLDVCTYVSKKRSARGIVPIENSSGGAIYETVDILLDNKPRIQIEEELTLHVNLALIGRKSENPKKLYSHFAPLEHCTPWVKRHLPRVERCVVTSTAEAALRAAGEWGAVALGSRRLAKMYGLEVLEYPISSDIPNVTSFIVVSGRKTAPAATPEKTTVATRIPNEPGSLYNLLGAFQDQEVNLSRIISRPIRGCPKEYAFLVDVDGGAQEQKVKRALAAARKVSIKLRVVGSYPSAKPYRS